ncbi:Rap-GAP domain-containing protein [Aphelenchoides fujianensis]|nr:Rap-GAP domain-containing protein [Aphelenchoides fujianensis]
MKPPTATADTRRVEDQLVAIRSRLAAGAGCAVGDRDAHNVWISSQLGASLCQPPMPDECVRKCNTIRVFLYDMGLVTRPAFGNELIALDTAACLADFHTHLHQLVDRQPAKRCETVSLFYVRADQTNATEILQNAEDLRATDSEFCTFVAQLGRARSVREPGFWTGHWQTAFAATPLPSAGAHFDDAESAERPPLLHRLDGVDDCIWWTDAQLEVAFQLPTERSMQRNLGWANAVEQRHDDLMLQQQKSVPRRFYYNNTRVSFERSDSDDSTATVEAEIGPSVSPSHRRVHAPRLDESPFLPPIRLPYERSSSSTITSTMSARQRKAQRPPLTALLSVDVGDSPPRSARFRSAASRVIERRRQSGGTWRLQEEGGGEAEVQPLERRRRATTTSASVSPRARELQRQQSTSSGGGFDANSPCSVARYTPSSTASSLAPTSRTTSSLTGDVNGKRNSDVSASFGIPPTPHPGSTAAARTRSTSTINSDCSTRMIPPTAHAGDRQQSAGAQAAGLVRVHVESVWTKAGQAGPLVDGVVVSTAVLPGLLRQTIANIARRKAVEVDQPTASYRRRQAIGELSRKFATPLGFTEFLDRFITV